MKLQAQTKERDEPPAVAPPCPYDSASFFSKALFNWAGDIIATGNLRELVMNDLPEVSQSDEASKLFVEFKDEWKKELIAARQFHRPISLLRAIIKCFFKGNFETVFYIIIESGVRIYQAKVLGMIIGYFLGVSNSDTVPLYNNGWFLSGLLVISGIIVTAVHHQFFFYGWRLGMRLRLVLTSAIYEKAVRLNLRALSRTAAGHIVNLCSQDVEAFQQVGLFVHYTYEPILEAIGVLYVGIGEVGISFLAGFAAIIMLIPLQSFFSKLLNSARKATAQSTDERLKLESQAISGVRLMKINGWEGAFTHLIETVRAREVHSLMKTNDLRAVNEAIFFAAPIIVGCFTFVTYVRTGGVLNPQKVFTVLTLFSIVQFSMTKFLAYAVQYLAECMVAINRIQNLLLMDEKEVADDDDSNKNSTNNDSTTSPSSHTEEKRYFSGSAAAELLKDNSIVVRLDNVSASWTHVPMNTHSNFSTIVPVDDGGRDYHLHLTDFSLDVHRGDLIVVVGPVGCSKSTLIMAMLGELLPISGTVFVSSHSDGTRQEGSREYSRENSRDDSRDAIAYCAQEPWIMSVSVRDNIIFGAPYDDAKYWATVEACALNRDLEELPNGDQTIIGDKGVNLSGGQRARVGLARALYSTAPLILLDDPLSAVDAKVGRHLFQRAICDDKHGAGLGSRTRILTTHQVQFLSSPSVSRIVVMKSGGAIAACGTYAELMGRRELDWIGTIPQHELNEGEGEEKEDSSDPEKDDSSDPEYPPTVVKQDEDVSTVVKAESRSISITGSGEASQQQPIVTDITTTVITGIISDDHNKEPSAGKQQQQPPTVASPHNKGATGTSPSSPSRSKMDGTGEGKSTEAKASIIVAENKESGEVRWSTYADYITQMGGPLVGIMLTGLMLIGQGLSIATNVWLAHWASMSPDEQKRQWGMSVYVGIVVAAVVVSVVRSFMVFRYSLLASQRLHNNMLQCIVRAPVAFFDANPLGRIINRFAKDVGFSDDNLPMTMYDFIQCSLMVVGAVAVVGAGCPYVLIALVPLMWYFAALRNYYLKTSREVKRLEAISRSPLFSHITHSLDGLVSLRAYKRVAHFTREHKHLLNINTRGYFCFVATSRWLGFRLDAMAVVLLAVSTFGSVAAFNYTKAVNPYTLAVGIMYVIQLAGLFQWCVRQSAEVENMMVSVERVLAYTRIPSEAALHGPKDLSQRPNWPEYGGIKAKQIVCTYRPGLPPVLKGVSFAIAPGQRVGVVGRTGAGKSTLMSVLLRLLDLDSGSLLIDGIDIADVGLHDLRPKISVIPQTPFLFSGTLRQNMDPFGRFADAEIWAALECVGMKTAVKRLRGDTTEKKNTSNMTTGKWRRREKENKNTERPPSKTSSATGGGGLFLSSVKEMRYSNDISTDAANASASASTSRVSDKTGGTATDSDISSAGAGRYLGVSGRWGGQRPSTAAMNHTEEEITSNKQQQQKQQQQEQQQRSVTMTMEEAKKRAAKRRLAKNVEEAGGDDDIQFGVHPDYTAEDVGDAEANDDDVELIKSSPSHVDEAVLATTDNDNDITSVVDDVAVAVDDVAVGVGGLDGRVEENGSNFSVGERQLLCLARALLQRNRILLLDEATANVDMETDALVQRAVRQEFVGCTVVMVAHRLQTVIDCDQVLVFSAGEITEAGHPHDLLRKYLGDVTVNENTTTSSTAIADRCHSEAHPQQNAQTPPPKDTLASLVTETGPAMAMKLRMMAAAAYKQR